MKWFNASIDPPPSHEQQVLVSINGIYYVATFDSGHNLYRLKEQPESFFDPGTHLIYWTEFVSEI